jgi:hypothetical protein
MAIASNLVRQNLRISQQAITSPIFRIKGQRSRWFYPDERLTPEHCEKMINIDISERGVAHSRFGYEPFTEFSLSGTSNYNGYTITGLKEVTYSSGDTRRVVVGTSSATGSPVTAMWQDQGGRDDYTKTNLTGTNTLTADKSNRIQFEFLNDKLWISDGVGQLQSWDGNLSNNFVKLEPKLDGSSGSDVFTACKGMFAHQNLLLVYGTTEGGTYFPTRLRYCDVDRNTSVLNTNKWTAIHRTEVYDGGTAIIGAVDNWGKALVFKEDGLYPGAITYDNLGHFSYQQGQPVRGFSPTGKNSIIARPEFCCGLAKEGIFVITPDMQYRIVNTDDITDYLKLNQNRLDKAQVIIREAEHQVRFYVTSDYTVLGANGEPLLNRSNGDDGFDTVLVWDWETGDTFFDEVSQQLNCASSFVDTDGKQKDWLGATAETETGLNSGNAFGRIYKGNEPTVNEDFGTPYNWHIKMSPNDLGLPGRSKHILNIITLYRRRAGQQRLTFRSNINEGRDSSYEEEVQLGTNDKYNSGIQFNKGKIWPGTGALRADVFVNRVCETISPEWFSTSPASIEGYIVEYIPLDS